MKAPGLVHELARDPGMVNMVDLGEHRPDDVHHC